MTEVVVSDEIKKLEEEANIICRERSRYNGADRENRFYIITAIKSVDNMFNGLRLLIVHNYLDYLEGRPTILGKFFDIFNAMAQSHKEKEQNENHSV